MSNKSKAKQTGSFGNKSKYQKSLERQVELRKQIAEFEEKQKQEEADKVKAETSEKKPVVKKTTTKKTKTENVSNPTE
jgi:hypothetical protein